MAEKTEKYAYALGRRKTSSANVRLYAGKGDSVINEKPATKYTQGKVYDVRIERVFEAAGLKLSDFHFTSKTNGGGYAGQVGALQLALARAIVGMFPDKKKALKTEGFMTRDPRMVERKKTGLRKARKQEQYSKR